MDDFLAGELSVGANLDILLHTEQCTRCLQERNLKSALRRSLRDSWNSQGLPVGLEGRIRKAIGHCMIWAVTDWPPCLLLVAALSLGAAIGGEPPFGVR